MKVDLIDGSPFVRVGDRTQPLASVLADLAQQSADLDEAADLAAQARTLAHAALVTALVAGDDVDTARERLEATQDTYEAITEQRQALDAQAADLRRQHAAAIAKRLDGQVSADLAALARTFDTQLKRISA